MQSNTNSNQSNDQNQPNQNDTTNPALFIANPDNPRKRRCIVPPTKPPLSQNKQQQNKQRTPLPKGQNLQNAHYPRNKPNGKRWRGSDYRCNNCSRIVDKSGDPLFSNGRLKAVIREYICRQCSSKKESGAFKNYTVFDCGDINCHNRRKGTYSGKNGRKRIKSHIIGHHKDNDDLLKAVGAKICAKPECTNIARDKVPFCIFHGVPREVRDISNDEDTSFKRPVRILLDRNEEEQKEENKENGTECKEEKEQDSKQQIFDWMRIKRRFTVNDKIHDDATLREISSDISKGLNMVARSNMPIHKGGGLDVGLNGLAMVYLAVPARRIVPFRSNQIAQNKKNLIKRVQALRNQNWPLLLSMLEYVENKRDQKAGRQRINRRNKTEQALKEQAKRQQEQQRRERVKQKAQQNQENQHNNILDEDEEDAKMEEIDYTDYPTTKSPESDDEEIPKYPISIDKADVIIHDPKMDKMMAEITDFTDQPIINRAGNPDLPKINQYHRDMRYYNHETAQHVVQRIKRCESECREGRWSKGMAALGDGYVVDLSRNDNWTKCKSKFPDGQPIKTPKRNELPMIHWRITDEDVHNDLLEGLSIGSSAGPYGINNRTIIWMVKNEAYTLFSAAINRLTREICQHGLHPTICRLLRYAKGVPLGKPKDGIPDADIRPITMISSIIRVVDRTVLLNFGRKAFSEAVGLKQLIMRMKSTSIGVEVMRRIMRILQQNSDLAALNKDITNAFGTICRQKLFDLILEDMPETVQWYLTLYGDEIIVDFGFNLMIRMRMGLIQGLSSSNLWFSAASRAIDESVLERICCLIPDFRILAEVGYVDDDIKMLETKYLSDYWDITVEVNKEWNLRINQSKTTITQITTNEVDRHNLEMAFPSPFRLDFRGNVKFLGIPIKGDGNGHFTRKVTLERIHLLSKKLAHIQLIPTAQIKSNLLLKFLNLNAVDYVLQHTQFSGQWIGEYDQIYNLITKQMLRFIKFREIMNYQLPISRRSGGLGLRLPSLSHHAARLLYLSVSEDEISRHFYFDTNDGNKLNLQNVDRNEISELLQNARFSQSYITAKLESESEKQFHIQSITEWVKPLDFEYINGKTKNRDITNIMDRKLIFEFRKKATNHDLARINCLSGKGSLLWITTSVNKYYGVPYANIEWKMALSLILGAKIANDIRPCFRCKGDMDPCGYHCLDCPFGPYVIRRHNIVAGVFEGFLKRALYTTHREVRHPRPGPLEDNTAVINALRQIPGDVTAENWTDTGNTGYFDFVIGNVFAKSYIKSTAKTRYWLATRKETEKSRKYQNLGSDLNPMALESLGAMGIRMRRVIQRIAAEMDQQGKVPYNVIVRRIRERLVATLMLQNAKMLVASFNFGSTESD